jgi:uncharacterized protein with von Willebrand factor type A (vWA) domain
VRESTATRHPVLTTLVEFSRLLRREGVSVGTADVMAFSRATAVLDPADLLDLYWAGRSTLVTRQDQIATYHRAFLRFFLDDEVAEDVPSPFSPQARAEAQAALELPDPESGPEAGEEQEALLGLVASDATTLRHKSFAACSPEELAALRRIMRTIRVSPPRRRTRRTVPGRGSYHDIRRTVRETMRTHGEPAQLFWRTRSLRTRPLVLVLDVSGSMADYSRALVQFAHSTVRATTRVEVFCFGTRLTRITRELRRRRTDDALAEAARAVVDWEGGTRIGASLETLAHRWGRIGTMRGSIVVICSDGLDRGDPATLEAAVRRLSRQCHRIVWLHPGAGDGTTEPPASIGMQVVAPTVDVVLPAGDLAGLDRFARTLAGLR